tara:strand:- start:74 stop:271 length:198 start_codon:yes stop_codon:yes gene_type:complete
MDLIQEFQQQCLKHGDQPVWVTTDLFYDLLEVGMITFVKDDQPVFWGHQLRVITEMPVEYKFVGA